MYNGSVKSDHSQGNYTKIQVSLACRYFCVYSQSSPILSPNSLSLFVVVTSCVFFLGDRVSSTESIWSEEYCRQCVGMGVRQLDNDIL